MDKPGLLGVPALYLISSFAGGMLLVHFYPGKHNLQFPYILFASALFLILEIIMVSLGYMVYQEWMLSRSYILDIFGFTVVLRMSEWIGAMDGKG